MKRIMIISLLLLLFVTISTAQNELTAEAVEVPESITDNHGFYFPTSTNTEWRVLNNQNNNVYMAKFDFEGEANRFAYYNTTGLRIMYSQLVPLASVPSNVKSKVTNVEDKVNKITLFNPEMTVYKVYDATNTNTPKYIDGNGGNVSTSKLPAFMGASKQ